MTRFRTRIAPSPTGDPHLGTAYIALFNYCFAKQKKGDFILRIEDTDSLRSSKKSEKEIIKTLRWLGLNWDEGPDIGGPYGPYRQSERISIYHKYVSKLINQSNAFYCFCSVKDLETMRNKQISLGESPRYDGRCLLLAAEEIKKRRKAKESHVVRLRVPETGNCIIPDLLRGDVEIPWNHIDMQILIKDDGMPTYFLANVIDDHLMQISHVLRGEEWLSSAPKSIILYTYLGWHPPKFCHLPLLRNLDKSKLSKRHNPTSIMLYKNLGFIPEAILNYLGRMGWSMPNEKEKFSLSEMINLFDLSRVSLGGPTFDIKKLQWLNKKWISELSVEELITRVKEWAFNPEYINKIAPLIQGRIHTFGDIASLANFFFSSEVKLDPQIFNNKKIVNTKTRQLLQFILWELESLDSWEKNNIKNSIQKSADKLEIKISDAMPLIFASITGKSSSVSVLSGMEILGSTLTLFRLKNTLDFLGGVSKREYEDWGKYLENDGKSSA